MGFPARCAVCKQSGKRSFRVITAQHELLVTQCFGFVKKGLAITVDSPLPPHVAAQEHANTPRSPSDSVTTADTAVSDTTVSNDSLDVARVLTSLNPNTTREHIPGSSKSPG